MLFGLSSLPTRRLWGLCRRGWAGTLPIAEERRTVRHGANGRGFTARPCGSDHGGRLYGGPVQECVPAGNVSSRSTSFARGFRKIWRIFFDTHADAGPMCLFAHKPPPERFRQCCRKRFSAFSDTPHYPSRKNSVVNTPESKTPAKDLRSRVCNRHPRRPVKGVLLTPKAKKIGRQALVKSVCRW